MDSPGLKYCFCGRFPTKRVGSGAKKGLVKYVCAPGHPGPTEYALNDSLARIEWNRMDDPWKGYASDNLKERNQCISDLLRRLENAGVAVPYSIREHAEHLAAGGLRGPPELEKPSRKD